MTFSVHGSAAEDLTVQCGTQEQISAALGGDWFDDEALNLVLVDHDNQHALVIEGSPSALRGLATRIANRVLEIAHRDSPLPATPGGEPVKEAPTERFPVVGGLPLRLSFAPDAIREHFEDDHEDPRRREVEAMSDEQLERVGARALTDAGLYRAFHEALILALVEEGAGVR